MEGRTMLAKRPVFFAAAFYTMGILAGANLRLPAFLHFLLGGVFLLGALFLRKKSYGGWLALIAVFFIGMGGISMELRPALPVVSISEYQEVTGRVAEISPKADGTLYRLTEARVGEQELSGDVFLKSANGEYQLDDLLRADAWLRLPEAAEYPGGFDDARYCAAKNVLFRAYSRSDEKTGRAGDFLAGINSLRTWISGRMDELFGAQAGTAKAFLIGVVSELDEELKLDFNATGISHILSVSGLHVGLIVSAVYFLLRQLRAGRHATYFTTMALLAFYVLLTGGRTPVLRAALMCFLWQTGKFLGKRGDGLTNLSVAYIAAVGLHPAAVFDAGLQLSFGAVFAILCLAPIFSRLFRGLGRGLSGILGTTLAANAGTLPIIINMNNAFWPLTILVNVAAVSYAAFLIPAVAVITLLYCLLGTAVAWLGPIGAFLVQVLEWMAGAADALPGLGFAVPSLPGWLVFAVFVLVFFCSWYLHISAKCKGIAVLSLGLAAAGAYLAPVLESREVSLEFLDCAGSSAVVIYGGDGSETLLGTGNGSRVAGYLAKRGIWPEQTFLLGDSEADIGGLIDLREGNRLGEVYSAAERALEFFQKYGIPVQGLSTGDGMDISPRCRLEVVYASDLQLDYEDSVLLLLLRVDGEAVCLFAGGADELYIQEIEGQGGEIPILQWTEFSGDAGNLHPETVICTSTKEYDAAGQVFSLYNTQVHGRIRIWLDRQGKVETLYGSR